MDPQEFIDRILEAENLTDNLEDDPASLLLRWGASRVRSSIKDLGDEEQAGQRVNALMAVMRRINRVVGNAASVPIDDTVADVEKLVELYARTTDVAGDAGPAPTIDPASLQMVASTLANSPPRQALLFLLDWLSPNTSALGAAGNPEQDATQSEV